MPQRFVSSVQKEFQYERFAVRVFVHGNDLLRQTRQKPDKPDRMMVLQIAQQAEDTK
jgi:hypothetical protein